MSDFSPENFQAFIFTDTLGQLGASGGATHRVPNDISAEDMGLILQTWEFTIHTKAAVTFIYMGEGVTRVCFDGNPVGLLHQLA